MTDKCIKLVNMKFVLLLLTICITEAGRAQTAEDSIKAAVNALFTAMRTADGDGLRSIFSDNATLQTITRDREGKVRVATENLTELIEFVKGLKKDSADERVKFEAIRIDGPLAAAWTPYQFYHNGKFSHCGVNSFQLVRLDGTWKIQYIIDTRRRTGCQP